MRFPFYKQLNEMDCGPTCLRMVAKYYGRHYNIDTIRDRAGFNKQGVSLLGISDTAEKLGLRSRGAQITYSKLLTAPVPSILHWEQNHYVVLVNISEKKAIVADPAIGIITYDRSEFERRWISNLIDNSDHVGTVLLLEPGVEFYTYEGQKENKLGWSIITSYLRKKQYQIFQIFLTLLITSALQLILPFLTQSMVDTGINTRNLQFITIVLFAQLMLTFSSTVIGFIRSRLQLRVSNSINISLLSDFWIKLTRLPISYFDIYQTGDTLQRVGDNRQIQAFLTGQTLSTVFAIFNFFIYSIILIFYNLKLFGVFSIGSLLYFGWVRIFLKARRRINYETFHISAKENNATLQLIQGMAEIRLNNAEKQKRWEWENIQAHIFKLNFRSLNFSQWQAAGGQFITQGKDILISFMVAQMVVKGELTFGTMLAVQYIIGQLSGPVSQFIGLVQSAQDAKISMERLNEVHQIEDEEPIDKILKNHLPVDKSLSFNGLTFYYPGSGDIPVLNELDLKIPEGKTTAIVGVSGSGKTTILKLLLKMYEKYEGDLKIGGSNFKHISPSFWRSQCGAVLQDGYIFNDSIARNIAVAEDLTDYNKLVECCRITNIMGFIDSLPNGFNTKLGAGGVGISQGQRQRVLIARALYKNPQYLFFDEATNALDANNEKIIVGHLEKFFEGRTVVVIAHRLSTVKNADKIVVLDQGRIVEEGNHDELTSRKGHYFELVKNQLELGM